MKQTFAQFGTKLLSAFFILLAVLAFLPATPAFAATNACAAGTYTAWRAAATGNWATAATWECQVSGVWYTSSAGTPPTGDATTITVEIQSPYNVTVATALNYPGVVTVDSGATLTLNASLGIKNNLNPGMIINGTVNNTVANGLNKNGPGNTPTVQINSGGVLNFSTTTATAAGVTLWSLNSASTVQFSAGGAQSLPNTITSYGNLTFSGSGIKTLGVNTTVNGTLSMEGTATAALSTFTLTYGSSSTLQYKGSSAQTTGTEFPTTFGGSGGVIINNSNGVTLGAAATITNGLTLTSGNLAASSFALTLNGSVTCGSNTIGSTSSTVTYGQSSAGQNVCAGNYSSLTFSNFNKTLASSGTIGVAATFTPGTATGHTITGSTISFNGTGAQTVPAFNYNNLTISGARTSNNVTLASTDTIGVAGTFNPSASFGTGNYVTTGSTVNFNASGAQSVPAFAYKNLSLSGSGNKTISASTSVTGNMDINGAVADLTAGTTTPVSGYLTLAGAGQPSGTWGSTSSTATNQNNTYFTATTGLLNVTGTALPTVTTQAVSSISTGTATGNGNISAIGGASVTQHGVVWDTSANPTTALSTKTTDGTFTTGAFTSSITGLSTYTTYHVRAYATNSFGTAYGSDVTFTTLGVVPTVTTQAVTVIGTTTATGNGNVTALGVPNPTQHGVVWSTSSNPTTADSLTTDGSVSSTGAFSSSISGLTPNTTYHVRAYATNAQGTSYGSDVSFSTLPQAPTVTTQAVTSITSHTATGNGNITDLGVPNPTQYGVVWDTSSNPTTALSTKTASGAASATGAFTGSITGLIPGTAYHVRAYATNTAGTVYGDDVSFTASASAPTAVTNAATSTGVTGASLNGTVNPENDSAAVSFDYGTATGVYTGNVVAVQSPVSGSSDTAVSFALLGLSPNTTYYYRVVATNATGTTYGSEQSFTTLPQAGSVTTQAASSVATSTATGNGTVTDLGIPAATDSGFVWATTATPTLSNSSVSSGAPSATGAYTGSITGLLPNTLYHVRAYLTNTAGTVYGDDVTFTTAADLPTATTNAASSLGITGATLNGTVNAKNDSTTVTFEYGTTSGSYGAPVTASQSPVTGSSDTAVSYVLTGLSPYTTYYYRVDATNASGTVNGSEQSFTTLPQWPTLTTEAASGIAGSGATGNGTITSMGIPDATDYGFVWGTSLNPTTANSKVSSGTPSGTGAFTGAITGLAPTTLYHVRAYATNLGGTSYGNDVTFTSAGAGPSATTGAASSLTGSGATLNGTVNAQNDSTTVSFEYGLDTSYGSTATATQSPVTGSTGTAVSAAVSSLLPNTEYHFRVKAVNATGTTYGDDANFTTNGVAPAVTTGAASGITTSAATLNGSVTANNESTTVSFEYGTTVSYGSSVGAAESPVAGYSASSVSGAISGLLPFTTYHFRVDATNATGTTNGADQTFTTGGVAPDASTSAATSLSGTGATLNGSVTAYNDSTTVTFEYGLDTSYGSSTTATQSPVGGYSATSVSKAVSGLTPDTTYHFRVKAVNSTGTTYSTDATFATTTMAPVVTTGSASGTTASGATLNGTVNPSNASTTVSFEYGTTTSYGSSVNAAESPLSGTSASSVSGAITGLLPFTTYHFRVDATNATGTTYGLDQSFTTSGLAPATTTSAASGVSATGVTFNGSVTANNQSTTVTFDYGTTTSYGSSTTATQSPVTGYLDTAVSKAISGLTPSTTYHFRVKAVNATGTTYGDDATFTTSDIAPAATTSAATSVFTTTAQLNGSVNADNQSTTVTFEYGTTTAYGTTVTATQSPLSGYSATAVSKSISGLTPGATYHFRVDATNATGTTNGSDLTFTAASQTSACTFTSKATGSWSAASTWTPSAVNTCANYPGQSFAGDAVTIASGNTVTLDLSPAQTISTLTVNSTGELDNSAYILTTSGARTVSGTRVISGTATEYSGGAVNVNSGGTYTLSGSGVLHLAVNNATAPGQTLTIASGGSFTQSGGSLEVKTISATGTNAFSQSGGTLKMYGIYTLLNTVSNITGGTVEFAANGGPNAFPAGSYQFNNVLIDSGFDPKFTQTGIVNLDVKGNWTNNNGTSGTPSLYSSATKYAAVTFDGNGSQTIGGATPTTFYNMTFGGTGTTFVTTNVSVNSGNLAVTGGTLDLDATVTRTATGGTLTVSNGATLILSLASNFPSNFTPTFNTGSTVNYDNTGAQTVTAASYSNLIFSGSGNKTVPTGTSVAGNLDITGAVADLTAGTTTNVGGYLTLAGVGQPSGTWGSTSSTATNQNNTYFTATTGKLNVTGTALPTVTTSAASSITTTTATGNGNITSIGAASVTQHGVVWDASANPTIALSTKTTDGTASTGAFTSSISGLSAYTTYHVRAYATNSFGTTYGSDQSFTTLGIVPTVTTEAVSAITTTTATGNGTITDLGVPNPTQHGVVWNTTGSPTTADSKTTDGGVSFTGSFTSSITGLIPNTTYYVRAYATNAQGTGYSASDQLFTTSASAPAATTNAATSIGVTGATLKGTVNAYNDSTAVSFEYGIATGVYTQTVTAAESPVSGNTNSSVSYVLTGLTPNTTYYYRVDATNTSGTTNGSEQSFTTLPASPVLTTDPVTDITATTATGNGQVTDLGTTNPTQHGVVWSQSANPTTADSKTTDGAVSATGSFTSAMTGLIPNTLYHVRAYATNDAGTGYGADVTFTTSASAPAATTNAATSIGVTGATLNGSVNAYNDSTAVTFEYGTATGVYTQTVTASQSPATGNTSSAVSYALTGLAPYTTYYYRVDATNTTGTTNGSEQSFTTLPQAPTVTTQAVSGIAGSGATGNGTLSDLGTPAATDYGIVWGTALNPTTADNKVSNGAPSATGTFTGAITGLLPNTGYHARAYATNLAGTTYGGDVIFTSAALAPLGTSNAATSVSSTGATLNGSVTANNQSTTVTFEYGTTTSYGTTVTATPSPVTGYSATAVSKAITGLLPFTTYHFRVDAANAAGTTNGSDQTFTTSAIAPTATTGAGSSLTPYGATLNGTVNANNQSSTVSFEYGLTTSYGTTVTATQSPVTGTSATAVSAAITGLTPGSTYHFRVDATNATGTTNGSDATFLAPAVTACTYTSRATGNWTSASTWTSSVGSACANYPGQGIAGDTVVVSSGNTVTLDVTPTFTIGTLGINSTGELDSSSSTLSNTGVITITGKYWLKGGTQLTTANTTVAATGTLLIDSGAYHTAAALGTAPSKDITVTSGGVINLNGGSLDIHNSTTSAANAINQTGGTIKVYGDWKLSTTVGAFNPTGGTVEFGASGGAGTFAAGTYKFYNVLIDSGVDPAFGKNANTINVAGNWTNNNSGTVTMTGTTVVFNGSGSQAIGGSAGTTFVNLTFSGTGTTTLGINTLASGNLSITSGTVDLASFTLNRSAAGGTFTTSSGTTLKVGSTFPANFSSTTLNSGSTVTFNGAAQTVPVLTYGTLNLAGSGNKSITTSTTTVAGNMDISGSAQAALTSGITVPVSGYLTFSGAGQPSGTWGSTSSTATNQNNTWFTATTGKLNVTGTALPTVTTQAVSGIGTGTATGNGNITNIGAASITQHGVVWDTSANPTIALSTKTTDGTASAGAFTGSISGLSTYTSYHVRAYATNSFGTAYGSDVTFTTLGIVPTVTTQAVTNIGDTFATGNGNLTDLGVPDPTDYGVVWNTTINPTIAVGHKISRFSSATLGAFTANITGLTANTLYHVRAYATNAQGTVYGNDVTFTTVSFSVTGSHPTYDGSSHAAGVTPSVSGTVDNIYYNGLPTAPTNAGTYTVTVDFTPTDTVTYATLTGASAGSFVIDQATPVLSITNTPVTYNATAQAATVSSGSVAGSVSTVKYDGSATVPTNAATYAITASFSSLDTNYKTLTNVAVGNFVISPATPVLQVQNSPVTFNGSAQSATVAAIGISSYVVPGSASNILYDGSSSAPSGVNTYAITADFTSTDTNYSSVTAASAGNFVIVAAPTDTPTPTATFTETPTDTATPTATITDTPTYTPSPTATYTDTPTDTAVPTATYTNTPVPTATYTETLVPSDTPTITNTPADTNTPVPTATETLVPSDTPTITNTPVDTNTPVPTATETLVPSDTPTITNTPADTNTPVPTATGTLVPSDTPTITNTPVDTDTPVPTATGTLVPSDTPTITNTPVNTDTPVPTATGTLVPSDTPTITNTPVDTDTPVPTATDTPVVTATATLTPTATAVPTLAAGTYDDTDPAWTYTGSWITDSGSGAYNNTLHISPTVGDSASVTFVGQQVSLFYTRMTDRGLVDVYIDGTKVTTLNENGAAQWQRFWVSDVLSSGSHTLRLVHNSGTYFDIDAIRVTTTPTIYTSGTYDDSDTGLIYSNNWATSTATGPYNGTTHYSLSPDEFVWFGFTGEQFSFRYTQMTDRGVVDVYIDGIKAASVNENGSAQWQRTWTSDALPSGTHSIRLVHASGSIVDLDAISVVGTAPVMTTGTYDDSSPAWTYSQNWATDSLSGPYNNTMHYSLIQNEFAQFSFSGQQFILKYTQMTDRGNLDVYVDGVKVDTINENGSPQWQRTWISGMFAAGTHTVRLVDAGGTVVDVDAVTIIGTASPFTTGKYDDTNSGIFYTTQWNTASLTGPYNGTQHYSLTQNEYAKFSFTGQQFSFVYTQMTDRGVVDVYVDDVKVASVNENGTPQWQRSWTSDVLPSGIHTVRLVHASGTIVDLDAVGVTATPTVYTAGTYDDADAGLIYSNRWTSYAVTGPFDGTLHYSMTPQEYIQFSFTGQQFNFGYTQMTDRGVVDVYIDGVKAASVNENGFGQWQRIWTSDALPSGTHTVRLVHASGTIVDFDSFSVVTTAPVMTTGTYDDSDAAWTYSKKWATDALTGPYNGSLHYSLTQNEFAQFSFSGQQFVLRYTRMTDRGALDVYVDGVKVDTINENGAPQWQRTWISGLYAAGTHTVRLVHASGTVADIDAVTIIGTAATLTNGSYDDGNSAIFYSNNWSTDSLTGPYNGTLHFSLSSGEYAQFNFTGQQFNFLYTQMTDRGVVDVYIDGSKVASVDENGTGQWQRNWTSDVLPSGTHTVRLVHASGTVVDLDAVGVTATANVLSSGTYDDADLAWIYSPFWSTQSTSGPYDGTLHFSQKVGETAQVSFTGTGFTLTYTQLTDRGTFDVYVDGAFAASINENGSAQWQQTWSSAALSSGTHTIRFVQTSGPVVDIDAITVTP